MLYVLHVITDATVTKINELDLWNVHGIMNTSGLLQNK